jgi:hypothetical protein
MRVGRDEGEQRCPTVAISLSANSMKSNIHSTVRKEFMNLSKPLSVSIYLTKMAPPPLVTSLLPRAAPRRFKQTYTCAALT